MTNTMTVTFYGMAMARKCLKADLEERIGIAKLETLQTGLESSVQVLHKHNFIPRESASLVYAQCVPASSWICSNHFLGGRKAFELQFYKMGIVAVIPTCALCRKSIG